MNSPSIEYNLRADNGDEVWFCFTFLYLKCPLIRFFFKLKIQKKKTETQKEEEDVLNCLRCNYRSFHTIQTEKEKKKKNAKYDSLIFNAKRLQSQVIEKFHLFYVIIFSKQVADQFAIFCFLFLLLFISLWIAHSHGYYLKPSSVLFSFRKMK